MKNKNELMNFDKKKIEYIQKKYKVEVKRKNKVNEISDAEKQRQQLQEHKIMLQYKAKFENGEISEEEIPYRYRSEMRKMYEREIYNLGNKLKKIISKKK